MFNESELFKVGDRVRPYIHYVKSFDRRHQLSSGWYTIVSIEQREEREKFFLFLCFEGIEGEYRAHQFTTESSKKPTR